jgi:hypothetical protein
VSELVAAAPRYTIVSQNAAGPAPDKVYAALRKRFSDATVDTQDVSGWPGWIVGCTCARPIPSRRPLIAEAPADGDAQKLVDEGKRLCGRWGTP